MRLWISWVNFACLLFIFVAKSFLKLYNFRGKISFFIFGVVLEWRSANPVVKEANFQVNLLGDLFAMSMHDFRLDFGEEVDL